MRHYVHVMTTTYWSLLKKKCSFVVLKKALDRVVKQKLWEILLWYNVNGPLLYVAGRVTTLKEVCGNISLSLNSKTNVLIFKIRYQMRIAF